MPRKLIEVLCSRLTFFYQIVYYKPLFRLVFAMVHLSKYLVNKRYINLPIFKFTTKQIKQNRCLFSHVLYKWQRV